MTPDTQAASTDGGNHQKLPAITGMIFHVVLHNRVEMRRILSLPELTCVLEYGLAGVSAVLVVTGIVAAVLLARRAIRTDPVVALPEH
ncbi:MAG: hypothetical protein WEE89_06930 [Gemmatimonadota bacterium]